MAKKKKSPRLIQPKEIEYYEKNTKVRWILALVFFVIGVVALAIGVSSCVSGDPGWRVITSEANVTNCSDEFQLQYYISPEDDISEVNREVTRIYTESTYHAFNLFYVDAPAGNGGLRDLNDKPNQAVTVAPALYTALEQIVKAGDRQIYLAPILVEYRRVLSSEDAVNAELNDPTRNPEKKEEIARLAAFAADPQSIDLKLLGNGQVQLQVSREYLDFAKANEIAAFLDFGWLCNAFCIDYIADALVAEGYTHGFLASYDGFTRVLDTGGEIYRINVYDRQGKDIYLPAVLEYTGPASLVFLRNYYMDANDRYRYYTYADGTCVTLQIDAVDGMYKSSTDNLLSISHSKGCAEMALALSPLYITGELDEAGLAGLNGLDIQCIWGGENTLRYTGDLRVNPLKQENQPEYTLEKVK